MEDPEDALLWMVDLMDATLQRVDKAVDEGHKVVVEKHQKVNFQARQVRSLPIAWPISQSQPGPCETEPE